MYENEKYKRHSLVIFNNLLQQNTWTLSNQNYGKTSQTQVKLISLQRRRMSVRGI